MIAAVGCGSSGGGGTSGTGGKGGGTAGKGGSSGAAGTTGSGAAGSSGSAGTTGTGGSGAGGSTGTGGASSGGSGGHAGAAGGAGGGFATATLLVDDDNSDNNDPNDTSPTASYSDTLFASLLSGEQITYTTYVVPSGTSTNPTGPTFSQLSGVSTIVWYTADNDTGEPPTLSSAQETTLGNWLDLGNKTLIIFSENLMFDLPLDWNATNGDTFAANYLGLTGGEFDVDTADGYDLANVSYVATGVSTVPAFSGLSFAIDADSQIASTADAVNPAGGTQALLTVQADPLDTGTNSTTAVASGHTKGTSKIIYVGIPIEDVHGTPTNTAPQLFHACLKYAGLVTN
jgi:hypothetical protein